MVMGVLGEGVCWSLLSFLPGSIALTAAMMFGQRMCSLFKLVMLESVHTQLLVISGAI